METKVITLCSSADFYKELLEVASELKKRGFKVKVPFTALKMKKDNDFDRSKYKTWVTNPKTWQRKTFLMRAHFKKVESADSVLVINNLKNGQEGYVGGNGLMEMSLAFYLKKKIYLWREPTKESPLYEEIRGMNPIIINQDLSKIK